MKIKKIWDGKGALPDEKLLFDLHETETIALGYVSLDKNEATDMGFHDDEEEIYVILNGRAEIHIGDDVKEAIKGDSVYVPRNTKHFMKCVSDEKLEYLYFANWPK